MNALVTRHYQVRGRSGAGLYDDHIRLAGMWSRLNGIRFSSVPFTMDALLNNKRSGGSWGDNREWPGSDHETYHRIGGHAVAILAEPYELADFHALAGYAEAHGLAFHAPPNPFASFWYPPFTRIAAITRRDFGPVEWLPDQLQFAATCREDLPPRPAGLRHLPDTCWPFGSRNDRRHRRATRLTAV